MALDFAWIKRTVRAFGKTLSQQMKYREKLHDEFVLDIEFTFEAGSRYSCKKVYDMLMKVPPDHRVNNRLKKITFTPPRIRGEYATLGSYSPDRNEITMSALSTTDVRTYTDPRTGEEAKPNGFKMTMLHEIGHSVDEANSIMVLAPTL